MSDHTAAEQIIVCMSREIGDGESVGLGIGTGLPAAAALLAGRTHARDLCLFLPGTGTFATRPATLAMSVQDLVSAPYALRVAEMAEVLTETVGAEHRSFYRPAQLDPYGNFNVTTIGPYDAPKIRLPGAAGLPDVMAVVDHLYFYVPRHDTRTFVPKLDFLSGIGNVPGGDARRRRALGLLGKGTALVITDLGTFDYDGDGRMRARTLHAGVTHAAVDAATGFELVWPDAVPVTAPPTAEELRLLREEIDPLGIRDLELTPARERGPRIREIFDREAELLCR